MLTKALVMTCSVLGRRLARHRGRGFAEVIVQGARTFTRRLNNVDFDIRRNGELRVLEIMAAGGLECVFDVGANVGEWSQLITELSPTCTVHAFEVVPATYEQLVGAVGGNPRVVTNNVGLSNDEGTITINCSTHESVSATACKIDGMAFHERFYSSQVEGAVRRASSYLAERGIDAIDFVKIDVEGMDLRVVQGFEEKLSCVRVVQFEYGIFNIASRDLLRDFCRYFDQRGFVVGKIFPRCVDFFEYHFDREDFHGSNYLAVRKDQKGLIAELSRFGGG